MGHAAHPGKISAEAEITAEAWRAARSAARAAAVEVNELDGADVTMAQRLIEQVWGPGQVPQGNLLRALAHAGNTLLAATRNGEPIGFALGFLGWTGGLHLHSHMTAAIAGEQSRGVGYALKLWQRAVCLEHGVDEMRWTFDPLIARNAYFNLVKLGATVVGFEPDFYGAMDDTVNAGDRSDRFEVSWRLRSRPGTTAGAGRTAGAGATAGEPGPGDRVVEARVVETLAIPRDYDELRRSDPGQAREVRTRARETFERVWAAGLDVGWSHDRYVFVDRGFPQRAVKDGAIEDRAIEDRATTPRGEDQQAPTPRSQERNV